MTAIAEWKDEWRRRFAVVRDERDVSEKRHEVTQLLRNTIPAWSPSRVEFERAISSANEEGLERIAGVLRNYGKERGK